MSLSTWDLYQSEAGHIPGSIFLVSFHTDWQQLRLVDRWWHSDAMWRRRRNAIGSQASLEADTKRQTYTDANGDVSFNFYKRINSQTKRMEKRYSPKSPVDEFLVVICRRGYQKHFYWNSVDMMSPFFINSTYRISAGSTTTIHIAQTIHINIGHKHILQFVLLCVYMLSSSLKINSMLVILQCCWVHLLYSCLTFFWNGLA